MCSCFWLRKQNKFYCIRGVVKEKHEEEKEQGEFFHVKPKKYNSFFRYLSAFFKDKTFLLFAFFLFEE